MTSQRYTALRALIYIVWSKNHFTLINMLKNVKLLLFVQPPASSMSGNRQPGPLERSASLATGDAASGWSELAAGPVHSCRCCQRQTCQHGWRCSGTGHSGSCTGCGEHTWTAPPLSRQKRWHLQARQCCIREGGMMRKYMRRGQKACASSLGAAIINRHVLR